MMVFPTIQLQNIDGPAFDQIAESLGVVSSKNSLSLYGMTKWIQWRNDASESLWHKHDDAVAFKATKAVLRTSNNFLLFEIPLALLTVVNVVETVVRACLYVLFSFVNSFIRSEAFATHVIRPCEVGMILGMRWIGKSFANLVHNLYAKELDRPLLKSDLSQNIPQELRLPTSETPRGLRVLSAAPWREGERKGEAPRRSNGPSSMAAHSPSVRSSLTITTDRTMPAGPNAYGGSLQSELRRRPSHSEMTSAETDSPSLPTYHLRHNYDGTTLSSTASLPTGNGASLRHVLANLDGADGPNPYEAALNESDTDDADGAESAIVGSSAVLVEDLARRADDEHSSDADQ